MLRGLWSFTLPWSQMHLSPSLPRRDDADRSACEARWDRVWQEWRIDGLCNYLGKRWARAAAHMWQRREGSPSPDGSMRTAQSARARFRLQRMALRSSVLFRYSFTTHAMNETSLPRFVSATPSIKADACISSHVPWTKPGCVWSRHTGTITW
jgi:hypothetical protein